MDDENENEVDESVQPETIIDWSSLLSSADSAELQELLRSPLDTAIHVLKQGREIQKISAIRTFADLLDSEGDKAIELVLPLIQKVLEEEASNLDIHCEAAVTYKNIFRNTKLTSRFNGLTDVILSGILENVNRQKDNLSAAAWLETLVEILEHVPLAAIKQSILPVALSQAEPNQRVQRRVIATRLIEKLCAVLPSFDIRKELAPCVQMLTHDQNANVRSSIAQRLGVIAQSLRNAADCGSLLLPCLVELCRDDEVGVREAILNTVAVCLPHLSKESRKSAIIPLLRKSTEQAVFFQDETLSVVAKNFGQWIFHLKDIMNANERKWFLDSFVRIANLSSCSHTNNNNNNNAEDQCNSVHTLARRFCAYNFPCIVMVYGEECFSERLLPLLEGFCSDPDEDIRCATAAGFHEIVALVPDEPALIAPFIELIRGGAAEVVGHLTGNLHRILPPLYKCASEFGAAVGHSQQQPRVSRIQLDRILIGCNRLVRNTGSWRSHQSYLINIAVIRKLIPLKDVFQSFVPMLKQEVLTARAIPCRIAASLTLLLFMREHRERCERQAVIDFFLHSIAKHRSCHRRRLYLDIIPGIMSTFSREFFHANFLDTALKMSTDSVSNIRLQLCHLLPKIKQNLMLPHDESILLRLEKIVREMLCGEQNAHSRQLIQTYACELSRAETKMGADKVDETRRREERALWEEESYGSSIRIEADANNNSNVNDDNSNKTKSVDQLMKQQKILSKGTTATSKTGAAPRKEQPGSATTTRKPPVGVSISSSSSSSRLELPSQSPWRMRTPAPKTAIVRPQPHVVVRSPSPMPRAVGAGAAADEHKPKSRLPLVKTTTATATANEGKCKVQSNSTTRSNPPSKEHLSKAANALVHRMNTGSNDSNRRSSDGAASIGRRAAVIIRRQNTVGSNTGKMSSSSHASATTSNPKGLRHSASASAATATRQPSKQASEMSKSAIISTGSGSGSGSGFSDGNSGKSVAHSRSMSYLRGATNGYGLMKVRSFSNIEKMPSSINIKIRTID